MSRLRPFVRPLVIVPLVAIATGAAFAGGMLYERDVARARDEWGEARLLSTAIDSVRVNALDSLPGEELIRRAVSGMLRELQDPYAAMLSTDGFEQYRGTLQGAGRGLGIAIRRDGASHRITRVAEGSPALMAGVRAGDRILAVNGVPVAATATAGVFDTDSERAPASQVVLTLWRAPHGDTVRVAVPRTAWHMPAVAEHGLLIDSIGYVRLSTISARSADELENQVEELLRRGAQSLVLDLRGNTGGLFEEGVRAASLFLPRGAIVSSLVGRGNTDVQPYRARQSRWTELPLTVLVDGRTASAAEVIAAALQDHGRALLVGSPTYGKGLVQRVVRLSSDIAIRLTTARWLTPRGVALERRTGKGAAAHGGIEPDVLLDYAARHDPYSVPSGWSDVTARSASVAADSLAMLALRERWPTRPLSLLEEHFADSLSAMTPATIRAADARAEWITVATRHAVLRVLEVERAPEVLLRYAARDDAAVRAGIDVVAPGAELTRVTPQPLPQPLSVPSGRRAQPRP